MMRATTPYLRGRGQRGTPVPTAEARLLRRATWRLGLQVALTVAVIVLALSGVAVAIVLRGQHGAADGLLVQATARADDVTDPPAGEWLIIRSPTGLAVTPGLPAGLPDQAALDRTARTGVAEIDEVSAGGNDYRIYTQTRGTDVVQAVLNLQADHAQRDHLLAAMLASGGLGLALAAGAGVWFGRRAVAPMATALMVQRRFVADASHELRTPLTLMSTRTQLLRRHLRAGAEPQTLTGEVDGVLNDARHLTDILEDLLLAADTRADTLSELVDVVALAGVVTAASAPAAAERSIAITTRAGLPSAWVRGSAAGLRRALTSLLDNALRHARTTVTLTASHAGAHIVVEVTDDGPGIDPHILPRLFDRFASTADTNAAPGDHHVPRRYGLGLALVSEITARHGGTISADNPPGGGATLRLTLPEAATPTPDRAEDSDSQNLPSSAVDTGQHRHQKTRR